MPPNMTVLAFMIAQAKKRGGSKSGSLNRRNNQRTNLQSTTHQLQTAIETTVPF